MLLLLLLSFVVHAEEKRISSRLRKRFVKAEAPAPVVGLHTPEVVVWMAAGWESSENKHKKDEGLFLQTDMTYNGAIFSANN